MCPRSMAWTRFSSNDNRAVLSVADRAAAGFRASGVPASGGVLGVLIGTPHPWGGGFDGGARHA